MPRLLTTLAAAMCFLAATAVQAATYTVDPVHSYVGFRIKHLDVSYVYGHFDRYDGTLTDGDAPTLGMTVQADSIDTNHPGRDQHLRLADFFDTEAHPVWSFTSSGIEQTEDGYRITGTLTIRGVAQEVAVDAVKTGEADHPSFGHRVGYLCEFSINRSDYGITYGITEGVLGDQVDITLSLQFIEDPPEGEGGGE
jgi:polyisoprenoid-binding protein YceI